MIGADGIRSKVREILLGFEAPRFIGASRSVRSSRERIEGFDDPDCTKWWGSDRHCLPIS